VSFVNLVVVLDTGNMAERYSSWLPFVWDWVLLHHPQFIFFLGIDFLPCIWGENDTGGGMILRVVR
jgi:hypothetical protein